VSVSGGDVSAAAATRHVNRTTTTAGDGAYAFTDLPVGTYTLSVSADGFAGFQAPVTVTAGHTTVATPDSEPAQPDGYLELGTRFYDPTAGRVTLDGQDIRELEIAGLRSLMGIVTQETILFHDTVRSNIAYGVGDATQAPPGGPGGTGMTS
jgi:hypothetical protein